MPVAIYISIGETALLTQLVRVSLDFAIAQVGSTSAFAEQQEGFFDVSPRNVGFID